MPPPTLCVFVYVPECSHGGQRITSSVGPHLLPCFKQEFFFFFFFLLHEPVWLAHKFL